ncbi:M10 family metallopeptidase, partial [Microvirga guangxiensis]
MPAVSTFSLTGDAYVDGILGDRKWAVSSLSYSFPVSGSYYGSSYGEGENSSGFGALNAAQQSTVRAALRMYAAVANLSFTEIAETATQHADLRFAMSGVPSTAWAYFPSTAAEGGDAWFNKTDYTSPVRGNYAYLTFLHEIGHALGLEHPHESGLPVDRDSLEYTVMSYRSYVGASTASGYVNETWGYAQSLMMYDIAALQHLYGANYSTSSGNTTYSWSPATGEMFINGVGQGAPGGNKILLTVWDGSGTDTYNFSNYATNLKVDLRPGEWTITSSAQLAQLHWGGSRMAVANIANALLYQGDARSLIENAIGGQGDDQLTGNIANNHLSGGIGNDVLYGLEGDDTLVGGLGQDLLVGGLGQDTFHFNFLSDGGDTILDFEAGIDRITFSVAGFGVSGSGRPSDVGVEFIFSGAPSKVAPSILFSMQENSLYWDSDGIGNASMILIAKIGAAAPSSVVKRGLGVAPADWLVVGTGDFNGDGTSDILWRH